MVLIDVIPVGSKLSKSSLAPLKIALNVKSWVISMFKSHMSHED